jgi:hypothetical protein
MAKDRSLFFYYLSIPVGKDRAVSRTQLCQMWGMGDRSVRTTISEIRDKAKSLGMKYFVASDSQGKGYWRTHDRAEIHEFSDQMMSRAKSIEATVQGIRAYLCEPSPTRLGE